MTYPAQPFQSPAPARGRTPRRISPMFWALMVLWVLLLGVAAGVAAGLTMLYRSEQILAGVEALGRDLGGRTVTEAAGLLEGEWGSRRIIVRDGEQSWSLAPEQLGIMLDADVMAELAYGRGRDTLRPEQWISLGRRLLASSGLVPMSVDALPVAPVWHFDRNRAAATLRTLAAQTDVEAVDAGIGVVDGRVETSPAVPGRSLDIAAFMAALEGQPWGDTLGEPGSGTAQATTDLPIVKHRPAITDVSALVAQVTPLLSEPIVLDLYDAIRDARTTWQAQPEDLGKWLAFRTAAAETNSDADDKVQVVWEVDEAAVTDWVSRQNEQFDDERYVDSNEAVPALIEAFTKQQPGLRLRVSHGERTHVVQPGETLSSIAFDYGMPYPWIQQANPDLGDTLFAGDAIRIPSADLMLPRPVVENKRIIISLTDQTMKAFENGQLKWDWPTSSGIPSSPTSPGIFQIQSHEQMAYAGVWDLYMPWFMGIYRPVPGQEFMNGFHGFPSRDQRQLLWTRNLGRPVTYGCLLLSTDNAKALYDWADEGVVVEIRP